MFFCTLLNEVHSWTCLPWFKACAPADYHRSSSKLDLNSSSAAPSPKLCYGLKRLQLWAADSMCIVATISRFRGPRFSHKNNSAPSENQAALGNPIKLLPKERYESLETPSLSCDFNTDAVFQRRAWRLCGWSTMQRDGRFGISSTLSKTEVR